jgi:hypothetical protein
MNVKARQPCSSRLLSLSRFCIMTAILALLSGCATTATHEGMTPQSFEGGTKHQKTVTVNISGGKELDEMGRTQISNAELKKALVDSITKARTFSRVIEGNGGDYLLTVAIISIDQPLFGGSFTVKMEAAWTLTDTASGKTVWREGIQSEHTTTMDEAFAGVERLRLATEGAARNNISQGLVKISKLNL